MTTNMSGPKETETLDHDGATVRTTNHHEPVINALRAAIVAQGELVAFARADNQALRNQLVSLRREVDRLGQALDNVCSAVKDMDAVADACKEAS